MSMEHKIDFAGEFGSDKHIDKLVHHEHVDVRRSAAHDLPLEHVSKFINDPDHGVRGVVAIRGTDEHRKKLLNDPHPWVRKRIAAKGLHHDVLKDDPDNGVRQMVASKTNDAHIAAHLSHDPDEQIRLHVIPKMRPMDMDHLLRDPRPFVRETVAIHGSNEHRKVLRNDPDTRVRRAAGSQE